jgi:hypothetical protein
LIAQVASVYENILVLSVGTGMAKMELKYTAADCNDWGVIGWLNKHGNHPLIDFFSQASADIVDMDAQMLFGVLGCQDNYLRIQTETLTGDALLMDCTTKSNMESLMEIGKKLLKESVARVNIDKGCTSPSPAAQPTRTRGVAREVGREALRGAQAAKDSQQVKHVSRRSTGAES